MQKYIARKGGINIVNANPKLIISTKKSPNPLPSPHSDTTNEIEDQTPLNSTTATQIKPIHCTTNKARGLGSSLPPLALALSTPLMMRTSPIASSLLNQISSLTQA